MVAERARFQLHLSTCVAMMFFAGTWLWGNLRKPRITSVSPAPVYQKLDVVVSENGWPIPDREYTYRLEEPQFAMTCYTMEQMEHEPCAYRESSSFFRIFNPSSRSALVDNVILGVLGLGAIALIGEWWARRGRKDAQPGDEVPIR